MNIKLLKAQSILQEALQEALFDLEDTRLKNIAVTRVECTRGREMAKVFLDENSLGDMGANDALKLLKKASGAIRANLQAQLSWYKTPNLVFEIDKTLNEINKLESIFKKIHNKGENSSLGAPCGDFGNLGRFADAPVQSHAPNSQKTPQFPPQNTRIVDSNQGDSAESKNGESTNPPQQTIEGIAVEVAEFLPNFQGNFVLSDETRLGVCEHSKFGKSMQDAPKSELSAKAKRQ